MIQQSRQTEDVIELLQHFNFSTEEKIIVIKQLRFEQEENLCKAIQIVARY